MPSRAASCCSGFHHEAADPDGTLSTGTVSGWHRFPASGESERPHRPVSPRDRAGPAAATIPKRSLTVSGTSSGSRLRDTATCEPTSPKPGDADEEKDDSCSDRMGSPGWRRRCSDRLDSVWEQCERSRSRSN